MRSGPGKEAAGKSDGQSFVLTPCLPVSGAPRAVVLRPMSTQWGQRLSRVTRQILVNVAGNSPNPAHPSLPHFSWVGYAAAS